MHLLLNPKISPILSRNAFGKRSFKSKKLITTANYSSAVAIFGGSKVSTKIKVSEYYLKKFGKAIIGGAMANTFYLQSKLYW